MELYFEQYTKILEEELLVAMGCTEPIAIAYASSYAAKLLGGMPEKMVANCSGNLIKNARSVTVPGTGGLKGIECATIAGAVSMQPELKLEVLSILNDGDREAIQKYLSEKRVAVHHLISNHPLHMVIEATRGKESCSVEIIDTHTGIGNVIKNGAYLQKRQEDSEKKDAEDPKISVENAYRYAQDIPLDKVAPLMEREIQYNQDISKEGLTNPWGEQVGKAVLSMGEMGFWSEMIAAAAAGSDARMNGCSKPVVINSGSGNQGLTVSMPIIKYAEHKGASHEELLRALTFANLVALHEKEGIGKLSAYCGAVCAAAGSISGIAFLDHAPLDMIENVITNTLGTISGMVCDGAKSSCAAKIATSLYCAILSYTMAKNGNVLRPGDGIIKNTTEETIATVGKLAADGMRGTDVELLKLMLEPEN